MDEIEVTCSHCGAVYDRGEHGILLHPISECEAALLARDAGIFDIRERLTPWPLST